MKICSTTPLEECGSRSSALPPPSFPSGDSDIENQLEAATVPLVPKLRPQLHQRCWPPSGWCLPVVLSDVLRKVLHTSRLEGVLPELRRVLQLVPSPPGPGHPLFPWSCMVRKLGQGQSALRRSCRKNCLSRRCRFRPALTLSPSNTRKSGHSCGRTACCWLLVVGCWLLVVGCLLFVVCCLLFVVCCLLFVFVVCCLLLLNFQPL